MTEESITLKERSDGQGEVSYQAILPMEQARLVYDALKALDMELPAPTEQPRVPVVTRSINYSFGKLPPGSIPRWKFREWVYFTLWSTAATTLFLLALLRS